MCSTPSGVLRLGAIPCIARYLLPAMLTRLAGRYADVDLRLREQVLNYCDIGASKLSRAMGASSLSTIAQMVANGHGVTLLPAMCIHQQAPDSRIRLSRFADPQPSRTVAIAWRKSTPLRDEHMALSQLILDDRDA